MAKKSTRVLIIRVAGNLFATNGLSNTTMEAVAAAAGLSRRTVYMYFRNKAEVYNSVVEMEISQILNPLRNILDSGGPIKKVLRDYGNIRTEGVRSLLGRNPLLAKDFIQGHSRIEKLREKLNNEEVAILTLYFSDYLAGEKKEKDFLSEDLAVIFLNTLRGNDRLLVTVTGQDKHARLTDVATSLFLKGLSGTH